MTPLFWTGASAWTLNNSGGTLNGNVSSVASLSSSSTLTGGSSASPSLQVG